MKDELAGIYLVVDPKMGFDTLQPKLKAIVRGGIGAIQVWDHWEEGQDKQQFVTELQGIAEGTPILINNDLDLALKTASQGVHFDAHELLPDLIPDGLIVGLTLSQAVDWSVLKRSGVDYISFCSMFPSSSTEACELVDFGTVREACIHFPGSVFASGGIDLENAGDIADLGVSGIALISGLLQANDPENATKAFKEKLIRK